MKPIVLWGVTLALLALVAGFSSSRAAPSTEAESPKVELQVEAKNPWTSLELNNQARNFQFAIVTDRTGGRRPGIFTKAVNKLNLMQPEFVLSVGDLIEGYSDDKGMWALEWSEFEANVKRLEMPFFFVPGNHDISNLGMQANWQRKFGRTYYEFRYQDVLFLALSTEEIPGTNPYSFGEEQPKWVKRVLDQHKDARWTFVFMHKPAWLVSPEEQAKAFWTPIEAALLEGDRNYTVFAGHVHNYARFERHGRDYIMLATTGGGSKLRGKEVGEFDHFTWVTMKGDRPVIANLMLDGIEDKLVRTLK
jgi:serine/threonine-protein phosphatase CPPED1